LLTSLRFVVSDDAAMKDWVADLQGENERLIAKL
jgi:hypothetical protein